MTRHVGVRLERPLPAAILVSLLVILTLLSSGCGKDDALTEIQGHTMGTTYSIKLAALPPGLSLEVLKTAVEARLERVNALMSTYRPDSELSRFNASRSTDWFSADPELVELVARAESISRLSDGAFDVTVGPLVDLWGFGPELKDFRIPDEQTIAQTRARVGHARLHWRQDPPALRKDQADLELDLSAIAKGHGVDQVAAVLDQLGVTDYLAEIGGELRARGTKPGGESWRIAIERPEAGTRTAYRVIELNDAAMATSGDYRNFYEQDGRIYSHTIDPMTGRPVEHTLASVTVIADDCATADGLATALLVLGPERGFERAQAAGITAFFVSRQGDDFVDRSTARFDALAERPR